MNIKRKERGFSLIELLVVIAILGMLAVLVVAVVETGRAKARDTRIKNAVGQMRWLAEIVYDTQGANYTNWISNSQISDDLYILLDDVDVNFGDTAANSGDYIADPSGYVTRIRYNQETDYCISAPLNTVENTYACIDRRGILLETTSHCPEDADDDGDPQLVCPS